mmetsp:Transcript_33264/g.83604  ORF Transcript_33264/g.83604 Transcript_33264/m.83604 type:complete len:231 (+) Transcript_33264:1385-2077(+)
MLCRMPSRAAGDRCIILYMCRKSLTRSSLLLSWNSSASHRSRISWGTSGPCSPTDSTLSSSVPLPSPSSASELSALSTAAELGAQSCWLPLWSAAPDGSSWLVLCTPSGRTAPALSAGASWWCLAVAGPVALPPIMFTCTMMRSPGRYEMEHVALMPTCATHSYATLRSALRFLACRMWWKGNMYVSTRAEYFSCPNRRYGSRSAEGLPVSTPAGALTSWSRERLENTTW